MGSYFSSFFSQVTEDDVEIPDTKVTLDELHKYNGTANGIDRIYLSVDGLVFDVTSGKRFYGPNGWYPLFAGHDITYCLAINDIKKKHLDVFATTHSAFDETQTKRLTSWKSKFLKKYKVIGRLHVPTPNTNDTGAYINIQQATIGLIEFNIGGTKSKNTNSGNCDNNADEDIKTSIYSSDVAPHVNDSGINNNIIKVFTLEELHKYDGKHSEKNNLIYLCVDGIVFDVTKSKENYGTNGGYNIFSGKDISYCLALGSLKNEHLNILGFEKDLNQRQKKSLKVWKDFYLEKYPVVGKLVVIQQDSKIQAKL